VTRRAPSAIIEFVVDIVDPERRSRMMAKIGPRHTKPELAVRRLVHRLGFRFRLHRRDLPGRPDLVLPRHRLVIFVNGCFWHRHASCSNCTMPKTVPRPAAAISLEPMTSCVSVNAAKRL
jgi:DNA mismatch endonuclease, patch repair protein